MTETTKNTTSRRAVTQGLAWSVPAVAAASAAPAMAATTPAEPLYDYQYQVNVGGKANFNTNTGCQATNLNLYTRDLNDPNSADGFGIFEMAGAESPSTLATIDGPMEVAYALPAAMFRAPLSMMDKAFTIESGNYSGPRVEVETMTDPATGTTQEYYVLVYRYEGSLTQSTSAPDSGITFADSALHLKTKSGYLNQNYCVETGSSLNMRTGFFAGGYQGDWTSTGSFTTDTGYTGQIDLPVDSAFPSNPESWITLFNHGA